MPLTEVAIEAKVDAIITKYQTTPITYYPYAAGAVDLYQQRTKTFGTGVPLVGRAIHNPTKEMLSVIGNNEQYEIAFLVSRLQMVAKFPTAPEGDWMDTSGQISWRNRRYKIEKAKPTGQVAEKFLMMVILANTIQGQRDP